MNSRVTIQANSSEECFFLEIKNDTLFEDKEENFFVNLSYSGNYSVTLGLAHTEITIGDDDGIAGL